MSRGDGNSRKEDSTGLYERANRLINDTKHRNVFDFLELIHDFYVHCIEREIQIEVFNTTIESLKNANAEMGTLNEEVQLHNLRLSRLLRDVEKENRALRIVSDDHLHVLVGAGTGAIIVNNAYKILRFTVNLPMLIPLGTEHIGKSVKIVEKIINYPDLEKNVIDAYLNQSCHQREVVSSSGEHFLTNVFPSKNLDNIIEGAILSLTAVKCF